MHDAIALVFYRLQRARSGRIGQVVVLTRIFGPDKCAIANGKREGQLAVANLQRLFRFVRSIHRDRGGYVLRVCASADGGGNTERIGCGGSQFRRGVAGQSGIRDGIAAR